MENVVVDDYIRRVARGGIRIAVVFIPYVEPLLNNVTHYGLGLLVFHAIVKYIPFGIYENS